MSSSKYKPYPKAKERLFETWKENKRIERIMAPLSRGREASTSTTNKKNIWASLNDTSNPITHPIKSQGDYVDSCTTGHQRSDGRIPKVVVKSRLNKLREQRIEKGRKENGILVGTKIYIGGYLAGTTDLEMKRKVVLEGGEILASAARATHIITSRALSGAKTHKYLHSNRINGPYIVVPEWVIDSIEAGKRKSEWEYAVVKNNTSACTIDSFRNAHTNSCQ